jgi:hypothetical protein
VRDSGNFEVVSPNDLAEELTAKVDQYMAAGASAVWVRYPKTREIHIFGPGGTARTLGEKEILEDEEVIPGFSIAVLSTLFNSRIQQTSTRMARPGRTVSRADSNEGTKEGCVQLLPKRASF